MTHFTKKENKDYNRFLYHLILKTLLLHYLFISKNFNPIFYLLLVLFFRKLFLKKRPEVFSQSFNFSKKLLVVHSMSYYYLRLYSESELSYTSVINEQVLASKDSM